MSYVQPNDTVGHAYDHSARLWQEDDKLELSLGNMFDLVRPCLQIKKAGDVLIAQSKVLELNLQQRKTNLETEKLRKFFMQGRWSSIGWKREGRGLMRKSLVHHFILFSNQVHWYSLDNHNGHIHHRQFVPVHDTSQFLFPLPSPPLLSDKSLFPFYPLSLLFSFPLPSTPPVPFSLWTILISPHLLHILVTLSFSHTRGIM